MSEGVCKLTGEHGPFVKSHILPAALTRPELQGAPLEQFRKGDERPIRRWTGWYDPQLVTAAGEKILSDYDNWAIKELNRPKLVWSSWGPDVELMAPDHRRIPNSPLGLRRIRGLDAARLRLFCLSLLWRAAASSLKEFGQVVIEEPILTLLTQMVRMGASEPLSMYPITLIQLSTRGIPHNYSAFAGEKLIPKVDGSGTDMVPIFRFFLDGLIVHFHRAPHPTDSSAATLGSKEELLITTIAFEDSQQLEHLKTAMTECIAAEAR